MSWPPPIAVLVVKSMRSVVVVVLVKAKSLTAEPSMFQMRVVESGELKVMLSGVVTRIAAALADVVTTVAKMLTTSVLTRDFFIVVMLILHLDGQLARIKPDFLPKLNRSS